MQLHPVTRGKKPKYLRDTIGTFIQVGLFMIIVNLLQFNVELDDMLALPFVFCLPPLPS